MTNHVMTGKQAQSIYILFWIGSVVVTGINKEAKQDTWISILMAAILFLPIMALHLRIIKLYPGLNIFDIILKIFGKVLGRIISLLFISYILLLGTYVMKVFAEFVRILNMPETPEFMTMTFLFLISVWGAKNGPENIGRVAKFCWPIVMTSVLLTFFVAFRFMDFSNLKPVMESDFKSLLSGAFFFTMIPLGEAVVCLCFFSAVSLKTNTLKVYIKALLSFLAILLIAILRNVLVLGVPSALKFYFSSYEAVSVISLGDFFAHIEVIIGINLMLAGFIKIVVCVYASSLGLTKIFNLQDQKSMVVPSGLLVVMLCYLFYPVQYDWLQSYRFYSIAFQILLPLIVWIGAEIQTKMKSPGSQATGLDSSE
jgi:spore germination protein (amino acid permease)